MPRTRSELFEAQGKLDENGNDTSPLRKLRSYLGRFEVGVDERLPPERELCAAIGISRAQLRGALAKLESEGLIWRHVGKGTFIGTRPIDSSTDIGAIAHRTNPIEIMNVRLLLEPEIAATAAMNASNGDIEEMHSCMQRSRGSKDMREYDVWNSRLHRAIAAGTHNNLLLALMDSLNAIRRSVRWGHLVANHAPLSPDHHSFADHEAIVRAIEERNVSKARDAMRLHLQRAETVLRARTGGQS